MKNFCIHSFKVRFDTISIDTVWDVIISSEHVAYPLRFQFIRLENHFSPAIYNYRSNCRFIRENRKPHFGYAIVEPGNQGPGMIAFSGGGGGKDDDGGN